MLTAPQAAALPDMQYVIFASYGNDSIALIQFAHERGLRGVHVAYSDTGWAASWWPQRVERAEAWVQSLGFATHRIASEGMEALVQRKKAWPRGGGGKFQFCTEALKEQPAQEWLAAHDPDAEATCLTGVRREESENRRDAPEWVTASPKHGGRELWQPLVRHTEAMRDALALKSPLPLLPFRSKECYPCVNARKADLRHLDDEARARIARIEQAAGVNGKGNARVMFSPKRHGGAVGIDAVVEDAKHNSDDLFLTAGCESGWCGG
jgi:3'-phosphoadenosine 5'-phosphosulfate sulfotransferase (PAPS reductase)/FAD synthetase